MIRLSAPLPQHSDWPRSPTRSHPILMRSAIQRATAAAPASGVAMLRRSLAQRALYSTSPRLSHAAPVAPTAAAALRSSSSSSPLPSATSAAFPSSSCARSRPAAPSSKLVTPDEMLHTIRTAAAAEPVAVPASSPLTDTFGRFHSYLRISLTERCNLRCVYCMPEEGVPLTPSESLLTSDEIQRLLRLFVSHGVRKVRFTGGEPTVRRDLVDLISYAGSLRGEGLESVCLTTNGLVLARKLPALVQAGLTHVNLSLDTLDEHKFVIMTRRQGFKNVRAAIDESLASVKAWRAAGSQADQPGLRSVKLNNVVMSGLNDMELLDFVAMTQHDPLEVRFIEYMPFDGNRWSEVKFLSYKSMLARIRAMYPTIERDVIEANETSKSWRIPGWAGRVGFITSMSEHFCATCNRLRITADGNLKVCLFGPQEVSLRDAMREGKSDEELRSRIAQQAHAQKHASAQL